MGIYFFMSMRFNKCDATDFGLVSINENTAINPIDNSIWIKKDLYDFGWGKENGYYKFPLPDFSKLIRIVLYCKENDDIYGAASIILEKYSDELLDSCEKMINNIFEKENLIKLIKIFKLTESVNRSNTFCKSITEIQCDFERWKKIAELSKSLTQED